MSQAIGIDLGGSNFRLAHLALGERQVKTLHSSREPVGQDRSPKAIVARLARAIEQVDPSCPVGIGFAGMLDAESGHIANSPHFGWRDVPFGKLLREAMPHRAVTIDNDVNYIAYGEYRHGGLRGAQSALCVLGGTGIGGAVIQDRDVQRGFAGVAGEIGHTKVVLGENARACHCGSSGCVEAYAGGRCLGERARQELQSLPPSLAAELAGGVELIEASHLDEAATRGDEYAGRVIDEGARYLGLVIANALTVLNPSHLLVAGGMLSVAPTLRQRALESMREYVNPPALAGLVVVDSELGDDAGLIGAAASASSAPQSGR